jgi:hypothetical protein
VMTAMPRIREGGPLTFGLDSVFSVSASKRVSGSVFSQSLYRAGKSMLYMWPVHPPTHVLETTSS